MAKGKKRAQRPRAQGGATSSRRTGPRTVTRSNVAFSQVNNDATAGALTTVPIRGANCHTLRGDLSYVVEYRVRSATMTLRPVVSTTDSGTYTAVLCPSNWAPNNAQEIMNLGGTTKLLSQPMTLSIKASDDEWVNHANGKARLYVCTSMASLPLLATDRKSVV